MKINELDLERLGAMLLRVAPIAKKAHHKWPKSTLRDYFLPEVGGEGEFIRDLFVLSTDEIVEKWYDGEAGAMSIIHPPKAP